MTPCHQSAKPRVWKQAGRTVSLRHLAWNWDADGNLTGSFVILVTLRVDRRGRTFAGTRVADSYDLAGTRMPEAHFEGVVQATRITVE